MKTLKIKLVGKTPLVVHNNTLADPLHPLKKALTAVTGKRKKTDADHEEIGRIEFVAGLYMDSEMGPIMPGRCLRACIIEGAKRDKMGTAFKTAFYIDGDSPIEYHGPRTAKELWEDKEFVWRTPVGNQSSTVIRTRPRFSKWEITFEAVYDEELIDAEHIENALRHSAKIGLCDARALGYGKFSFEVCA
jgi:hypothetical protein